MKKSINLILGFVTIFVANSLFAQQATGFFPLMDGGMESQIVGQIPSTSGSSVPINFWSRSSATGTGTIRQISTATARSGNNFLSLNNSSTGSIVAVSPSITSGAVVGGGAYIIQFFYRATDLVTLPNSAIALGASNASGTAVTYANFIPNATTNNAVWLKSVTPVVAANGTAAAGFNSFKISGSATTNSKAIDIDDWIMYPGISVDDTIPANPGAAMVSSPSSVSLNINWGAAADVDGGGYLVVRYTFNPIGEPDPNPNGIYAVGNTIGNGNVVYSGTSNSCTSTSLTANTLYYYRIYTVDKAFNYSAAVTTNGSTNSNNTPTTFEYYIDAINGDDANPGTILLPWKNVSKINSLTLVPGNKIYLKSGCTWTSQRLRFLGSGTLNNPIVINKYGTGPNPVLAGNGLTGSAVVYLYNQQYIEINNLEITNSPNGPINSDFFVGLYQNGNNPLGADRRGVMVAIDNFGTANHIYLKNLNIHHIKGQLGNGNTTVNGAIPKRTGGIYFTVLGNTEQTATKSRFNDILIDSCNINYCENTGLAFDNEWNVFYPGGSEYNDWYSRRFTNVKVSNNIIHHIGKNAMIIRCTDETGLIEKNICYETAVGTTGNTMFTARAKGTVFQYNEGYYNRATTQNVDPGNIDGSMYDPDFGSIGIIFQYSYSHDNSQGLYWGCNTRGSNNNTTGIPDPEDVGCTARYNISQNDLGDLVYFNYSSAGNEIYNNVFYIKPGTSPNIIHENSGNAHTYNFRNNIIYNLSSATSGASYAFGTGPSVQNRTIEYNIFFGNHPISEPSDANKLTSNPLFVNPGSGGIGLNSVDGYKLQSGSPCINTGMLVPNHATKDFWGNIVPAVVGQNPDRGSFEFSAIVPVVLINFQGSKNGNSNKLIWTTTSEINNAGFQLQRSNDGVIFTDFAFIPTQTINGNSIKNLNYNYTDNLPFSGDNFYRLKIIDKDGKQSFSSVVALKNNKQNFSSISVYPNPIVGKQFSLSLQNVLFGSYDLYLLDMTGRKIALQNITHSGNDGMIQINLSNNITKGIYRLILNCENEILNTPIIIQ